MIDVQRESEDIASRLESIYHKYHYESELPSHDDLVAKLDSVTPNVLDAIRTVLDRDDIYPISEKEAKMPLSQRFIMVYVLLLANGVGYVEEKIVQRKEEPQHEDFEGFPFLLHAIYGGFRSLPSAVKKAFQKYDPNIWISIINKQSIILRYY